MATPNVNAAFGFKWAGLYGDMVTPNASLIQMKIASTDTTAAYGEGDPLKFLATGYVTAFTNGTVVSQLAGIFKSCEYYNTAIGRRVWSNYWPAANASGDVLVSVIPCMGSVPARFLVQASGAAITMGSLWSTTDLKSGTSTAGSATSGFWKSAATIDSGNTGTSTTTPWRIVGLWSDIGAPGTVGTDNTNSYNWVLVAPNNFQAAGI